MKKNKGAISIFALLSMMFFLIFIMVAYNNVMQKGKNQVETEGILVQYYKPTQTASEYTTSINGGTIHSWDSDISSKLRGDEEIDKVGSRSSDGDYILSNGKVYEISYY